MGIPDLFIKQGIFPGANVRVTQTPPTQARSESCIVVDPARPNRLLGASKWFNDLTSYTCTLGSVFSDDGGYTWQDLPRLPLPTGHDIFTDPSATFHPSGSAWIMGDPGFHQKSNPQLHTELGCDDAYDIETTQMLAFHSPESGVSPDGSNWSAPVSIVPLRCTGDDKGWLACDNSIATKLVFSPAPGQPPKTELASPYHGRLYAIWASNTPLRFARSSDNGKTWLGMGSSAAGSDISLDGAFAPDISIGRNGTIHVLWHNLDTNSIRYLRSTDGGESFHGQVGSSEPKTVVGGVQDLHYAARHNILPSAGNPQKWPVFDGANFRVATIICACCFGEKGVAVAWADTREGRSRIYYSVSSDDGETWSASKPMLVGLTGDSHQFHPQLAATESGVVGCAMYSYSKTALAAGHKPGIDVLVAASFDNAATWTWEKITGQPWDPSMNAPFSHSDPAVTFIGDYFGFDAGKSEFHVLWTDTRDQQQELYYCRVDTEERKRIDFLAVDPLAVFLGSTSSTYLHIHAPDPGPIEYWTHRVREAVAAMTPSERRATLARVKAFNTSLQILEKELE